MRLTGLLAFLLFVLIVFFAAPAASFAQTSNAPAIKADKPDPNALAGSPDRSQLIRNEVGDSPLVVSQPLLEHNGDLVLRGPLQDSLRDSQPGDDFSCFMMRTYIMARDDKTSDATHLVRKVKCTPARKFNFKTADDRAVSPAGEKQK
jgi:hypothetical protein